MNESVENIAQQSVDYARNEINLYGVPDMLLLDISLGKGRMIAKGMNASLPLVETCIAMMDLKLGQAFKENRIKDHIRLGTEAATSFLKNLGMSEGPLAVVVNAIEAHHGGVPFKAIESEIAANADCYRFVHPKGVFLYLTVLGKRCGSFVACLDQAEAKMDEKYKMISLPLVKEDLYPIYEQMKKYFKMARE
jgi:hypothetical protein